MSSLISLVRGSVATTCSTPSESRRITSADGAEHYVRPSSRNELQHSHSTPRELTTVATCESKGRLKKQRSEASFDSRKLTPIGWRRPDEGCDRTPLHGQTTTSQAQPGRARDVSECHEFWDLNSAAKEGFLASVITLPLKFKSAYALPRLLTG